VHDDGRWRARGRIDDVELPDSVQAVILARLDLLTPDERRVAQRAAVVGRLFWDGALAAVGGVDELDAMLRTLRRREFVVERVSSTFAGEREFVFKHVLIRDVAYESLPRGERGRAHVEAAEWIERRTRDRSGRAEMLAHHYDAAFGYLGRDDLRLKAREHLLDAAAEAHRRFAVDEGERLARRAVELSEGGERLKALEALADLHYLSGDAAWRAYADALSELAEDDPAYARIAGKAAEFACRWIGTMRVLPSVEDVNRVIDAGLRAAAPASPERTLLLVDRAYLMVQREGRRDEASRAAVEEAVAAAEALGDPDLRSAGLDLRQAEQMHSGRYGEMLRTAMERLALIPRLTDAREAVDALAMAAWSAQHTGRFREAERHATACIETARGVDAGSYLHGLTWRVDARFHLGDWDGALADQAELERVAEGEQRDMPASFTMHAYLHAGLCHERRGNTARADGYLETAFRYFAGRTSALASGRLLGTPQAALILARRGRFDDAVDLLQIEPRTGGTGVKLAALCEILAEQGAWDQAADAIARARDEAAACELQALPAYADRLEGRAAAAAGDAARAAELLRRSADTFHELEARWEEAWSRLLLGEALAVEDRVAAGRERSAALDVFQELGSVREAERARTPLVAV